MNTECRDLDEALRDGTYGESRALVEHAEGCPACSERVRAWRELSDAARGLLKSWDSPGLWRRIEQALVSTSASFGESGRVRNPAWAWITSNRWLTAGACVTVLALSLVLGLTLLRSGRPEPDRAARPDPEFDKRILTEQALREVEEAESNYIQSIEKLSKLADPLLQKRTSPVLLNYRERLLLLDEAIADCRANIIMNRSNAHLRKELVAIYQEKQRTLEDLMKEKTDDLQ